MARKSNKPSITSVIIMDRKRQMCFITFSTSFRNVLLCPPERADPFDLIIPYFRHHGKGLS